MRGRPPATLRSGCLPRTESGIRMGLRASEWVTVAYFAYLAGAAAVVRGIGRRRRRRAIGTAVAVVITVLTLAWLGTSAVLLRDWMPLVYILLGYWLPALLVTGGGAQCIPINTGPTRYHLPE